MASGADNRALTAKEAAEFLATTRQTLEAWRHRGQGPAYIRQGRSIRYRLADLTAWQEKNRVEPGGKTSCQKGAASAN